MASKGDVGIDIDLCQIPLREPGMEPFEIMVSESQERMLCVVAPERVGALLDVCERWEVLATPIGSVTTGDRLRVLKRGAAVADLPVKILVDDCPLYDLEPEPPEQPLYRPPEAVLSGTEPAEQVLLALLRSVNIASRRPVFEQYDPVVQSRTVRRPDEADAAVLALPGGAAIAVSIDGNGRRVACDPRRGAAEVVYECAANLACVGAEPLGLTNCLNFGNPEKPHVAWQLTEAVTGLAEACEQLGVPVVGGNVSLYNEAPTGPIFPTPVVGIVGRLPDAARAGQLAFAQEGDAIALVGPFDPTMVGSELAKLQGRAAAGKLPPIDPVAVAQAHREVRGGVRSGALRSAHDIAEGGIAVALAECCIAGSIGATVSLLDGIDPFAEALGQGFIVSGPPEALAELTVIGRVGGSALTIEGKLAVAVSELRDARELGLAKVV
jgi:phosphoribosylformylglycinamidine synthase